MHTLLSLLFSVVLTALIYGLSLIPTATLSQPEEPEELASRTDQNGTESLDRSMKTLSRSSQVRRSDAG